MAELPNEEKRGVTKHRVHDKQAAITDRPSHNCLISFQVRVIDVLGAVDMRTTVLIAYNANNFAP